MILSSDRTLAPEVRVGLDSTRALYLEDPRFSSRSGHGLTNLRHLWIYLVDPGTCFKTAGLLVHKHTPKVSPRISLLPGLLYRPIGTRSVSLRRQTGFCVIRQRAFW